MVYVLALSIYFPPEFGGGATRAWNITHAMAKRGYRIIVIATYPQYPYGSIPAEYRQKRFLIQEQFGDITVLRFPIPTIAYVGVLRRLLIFLYYVTMTWILLPIVLKKFGRPSIIYALNPNLFSVFAAYPYQYLTGAKLILDVPDLWPEFIAVRVSSVLTNLSMSLGQTLARFAYSLSDYLTTVSDELKMVISRYGIPSQRIQVVFTGVDIEVFRPLPKREAENALRSLLPESIRGKFVVLYSGIIGLAYDLEVLLKVSKKLKDIPDIIFLIQGEGERKAAFIDMCNKGGLQNVVFTPILLPRRRMPQLINISDLCIIPFSKEPIFRAFFPVRFFEYTACGKPIIYISSKGQAAKLLIKWDAGIVFESNQLDEIFTAIVELYNDAYQRKRMGRKARSLAVTSFSLECIGEQINSMLKRYNGPIYHAV